MVVVINIVEQLEVEAQGIKGGQNQIAYRQHSARPKAVAYRPMFIRKVAKYTYINQKQSQGFGRVANRSPSRLIPTELPSSRNAPESEPVAAPVEQPTTATLQAPPGFETEASSTQATPVASPSTVQPESSPQSENPKLAFNENMEPEPLNNPTSI